METYQREHTTEIDTYTRVYIYTHYIRANRYLEKIVIQIDQIWMIKMIVIEDLRLNTMTKKLMNETWMIDWRFVSWNLDEEAWNYGMIFISV